MVTETTMLNVNGTGVYVALRQGDGSGPPLLLFNGIGANLELFDPFVNALEQITGRKIGTIRLDVPGVGGSPTSLFPLRFRDLARIIAQLLDMLGHQYVDVLGISWGGGLAQEFAYHYPQRCRCLVLVATSTGVLSFPGKPDVLSTLLSPRRYFQPSYLSTVAPKLYGGSFRTHPDLFRIHTQLARAPGRLGYYWQLLAMAGWTSILWLHHIRQPTLILAGNDDPIVPQLNAKIMAYLLPNATLSIVDGGHLFLLTEAQQAASIVHQFLTMYDGY